jgi:hypothetical protein
MTEQEVRPWMQALSTVIRMAPKAAKSVDTLCKSPRLRAAAAKLSLRPSPAQFPRSWKKGFAVADMVICYALCATFALPLLSILVVAWRAASSKAHALVPLVMCGPCGFLLALVAGHFRGLAEEARARFSPRFRRRLSRVMKRQVR